MNKWIAALMAALMLLALTACSGKNTLPASVPDSECVPTASASENSDPLAKYDKEDAESILQAVEHQFQSASASLTEKQVQITEAMADDYQKYTQNKEPISAFYEGSYSTATALYAYTKTAAADYFRCIAAQGIADYSTWNDAMDAFYSTWNDGMQDFYTAWTDAYDALYAACDDAIGSASSTLKADTYSDVWSAMYQQHSNAWSTMYQAYSDAWSEIYAAYSNVWSGFYAGNSDVDALLSEAEAAGKAQPDEADSAASPESASQSAPLAADGAEVASAQREELVDGMRPAFKAAMDSYEAFYDEYCTFLKKYSENPSDIALLAEYGTMLVRLDEMNEKFDAWEEEDLNDAETKYYIAVNSRISQKLIDVAQ